MRVAARKFAPYPERLGRRGWTHERSAIEGDLRYWGARYRKILLSEGFSAFSPFATLLEGRSAKFRHKILIPDMSPRAWRINLDIWALPTSLAWALCGRYALPPRDDNGQLYTSEEIGYALGCSAGAYRERVGEGRRKLMLRAFPHLQF